MPTCGPSGCTSRRGAQVSPLETADGAGNFYLKPNGVFFIGANGRAGVMETAAFAEAKLPVRFATQSGPMLVIGGQIHPKFLPDGTSRYTRNGVGVAPDGTVVFAITRDPLSLGSFARFFRDAVDCPDALFFDGAVSSLWAGGETIIDSGHPAGPVVAVFGREALTQ
ncbi:MAG: phosphodiester glycosidase family protein [Brucellaceae bacterium]|nr:phosphodiester glycosidase family protein [Brucellaceae bacterium]